MTSYQKLKAKIKQLKEEKSEAISDAMVLADNSIVDLTRKEYYKALNIQAKYVLMSRTENAIMFGERDLLELPNGAFISTMNGFYSQMKK